MSVSLPRAQSLCTRAELSLVKASARSRIGKLSPAQLKLKTQQAMRLRDKWGDLARGQRRKTQAKQRSRMTEANARSARKAELFAEVLERFRSQAQAIEKRQQKASRATATKAVGSTRKKPAARAGAAGARTRKRPVDRPALSPTRGRQSLKTDRRTQLAAATSEKQSQFKVSGLVRKFKHTAARNRRNQARRDARL